jgi:putative NADH-flavin reductase
MKLAVLGASGGCGAQLVSQAKLRGHEVTAVVRSQAWQPPSGVQVLRGDLTNETFLREAVKGKDAVLSALGLRLKGIAPWNKPDDPTFLTRSTNALVAAMKAEGIKRVIAISSGGVGDSFAVMPGIMKFMIKNTALKYAFPELERLEAALLSSGLDVLMVRPSGLTDGPTTGQVKVARSYTGRATISRADVASWMLEQLGKPVFEEKTPMISVTGVA